MRGNAPIKNAARMPNNTPHVILMLSSCMAANLRRVSVPHFGIGTPHLEGQRAREIVNRFLMPQRGSGGADHSWQNAAKQNQDDDGGQDAHDDSSCKPSWQVTARHVDTSIRRARGKARWPPFSPVRLALILPGPWDSTSAKWRTGAAKRPRSCAPRHRGRSSRMPNTSSPCGTSARPSGCRCCSRRRSAQPSQPAIGSYGRAAPPAVPRAMSTCGPSTGTAVLP